MSPPPCKTVGELVAALQKLDQNLPLHSKDARGSHVVGIVVEQCKLAYHKVDRTLIGDVTSPYFEDTRWCDEFDAVCIKLK